MSLLRIENLSVYYPVRGGSLFSRKQYVHAVDVVSLQVERGEIVGLVGESGCGKSTLGRAIVGLVKPTSGKILLNGRDLTSLSAGELRAERKNFQMIFQDPYGSLNPKMTVGDSIMEILSLHRKDLDRAGRRVRAAELMEKVGLSGSRLDDYPHQFSGGQRQRIGITRALAAEPGLIIADEPVSALDVSVQAQIINLLSKIRREDGTAFLFIAHDLAVVRHISDRIAVMYMGKIVETGTSDEVCSNPLHPYTKALLSAVPRLKKREKRIVLSGDVPSPINPPSGCRFHPRCPFAIDSCRERQPELHSAGGTHWVSCRLTGDK